MSYIGQDTKTRGLLGTRLDTKGHQGTPDAKPFPPCFPRAVMQVCQTMPRQRVIPGDVFGRLTAREQRGRSVREDGNEDHHSWWACDCVCGRKPVVRADRMVSGKTSSCGCLGLERLAQALEERARVIRERLANPGPL